MAIERLLTLADGGVLFFAAVAAIVIVAIVWSICYEKKRRETLAGIAQQMGLSFDPKGGMPAGGFQAAPLFDRGRSRKAYNVMSGRVEDIQLHLFDYKYTTGSGKNSSTHRRTVVAFEVRGFDLPKFHLKGEHFGHTIAKLFGFDDIDFSDFPRFSKAYHLSGDNENAIRDLFTADVLDFFEMEVHQKWNVEAWDDWLVMYRTGGRVKPVEWPTLLQEAMKIVNQLTPGGVEAARSDN